MEKIALVACPPWHRPGRGYGTGSAGWAVYVSTIGRGRIKCLDRWWNSHRGGLLVMAVQADVACREQVNAMVRQVEETFGPVSLLVNNAGVAGQALFQDITDELWHRLRYQRRRRLPRHSGGAARHAAPPPGVHHQHLLHLGAAGRQLRGHLLLHQGSPHRLTRSPAAGGLHPERTSWHRASSAPADPALPGGFFELIAHFNKKLVNSLLT